MEQKENAAINKATQLVSSFEKSFLNIQTTLHPAGIQGEIAGKSSNVAFAARRIVEVYRTSLQLESCNVMVTVMDGKQCSTPLSNVLLTALS
jgi:hypothetical protein